MVNALIDRGIPAVMKSFSDMADELSGMMPSEQQEYLRTVFGRKLVYIDALSIGGESPIALRMKKMIMDHWVRCSHSSIITTGYSLHRLKEPKGETEKEIFGNLLGRCVPIGCLGEDLRKREGERRMEEMGKLLREQDIKRPDFS